MIEAVKDPRRGREIHYGGITERAHLSLAEQLAEYRTISEALEGEIAAMSDDDWRAGPSFEAAADHDLGGMIEGIMVLPPRPLYRHLPVHVPDAAAYIRSLR